jgi:hypothetical protein
MHAAALGTLIRACRAGNQDKDVEHNRKWHGALACPLLSNKQCSLGGKSPHKLSRAMWRIDGTALLKRLLGCGMNGWMPAP